MNYHFYGLPMTIGIFVTFQRFMGRLDARVGKTSTGKAQILIKQTSYEST